MSRFIKIISSCKRSICNSIKKHLKILKIIYLNYKKNDASVDMIYDLLSSDISNNKLGHTILKNGIDFIETTVEDIIIPRVDVFSIDINSNMEQISSALMQIHYSRILLHEGNLDQIIGFVHIKDILEKIILKEEINLKNLVRKPIVAPVSTKLVDLLAQMQSKKVHIAVVVDEYGGTEGIVTNRNIIESLVGSINDEHDYGIDTKNDYHIISNDVIIASGRVKVETMEELLKVELKSEEEDFDTISGLVILKAGKMPKVGAKIAITDNIEAEILEGDQRSVKKIKFVINQLSEDN